MKTGSASYRYALIAVVLFACSFGRVLAEECSAGPIGTAGPWVNGSEQACSDFRVLLVDLGIFGALEYDSTDEGWVFVNLTHPGPRYQSVSGLCRSSQVAYNDNTANHDSHDHGTDIEVDAQYLNLLSNINGPNSGSTVDSVDAFCDPTSIELEWETGTFPGEHGATVQQRTFPRWAWPNVGDRVWTNGAWIFDCGHSKNVCTFRDPNSHICFQEVAYFHTEIHPPRAIASMRNQAATLPSSGTTPVPVTATDLYIHGRAGMVGDVLQCGMPVVLGGGSCDTSAYPHRGFPINVEDFDFDICLPVRPNANALLKWVVAGGPANSVPLSVEPMIKRIDAQLPECANADAPMDGATHLHVHIPLGSQNVGPDEVYARRITAGWIDPPSPTLQHLNVSVDRIDLHDSKDNDELFNPYCGEDGELSFFWATLDRAPDNEWIRLADYAPVDSSGNSVMNDYGPSLLGHSFVDLTGAAWDFYVRQGQPLNLKARGYEQDCYDQFFGDHTMNVATPYLYCFASPTTCRDNNNDELDKLDAELAAPDYGGIDPATGTVTLHPATPPKDRFLPFHEPPIVSVSDYAFDVTVRRVAPGLEDTSDLAITKTCSPDSGTSFLCSLRVSNAGPGLPRNVVVDDVLTASAGPASFTLGTPTAAHSDGSAFAPNPCSITGPGHVSCAIGTIPVGDYVTIAVRIISTALGNYDDVATVATDSTDPGSGNNQATGGWTVVPIDFKPGNTPNAINVTDSGSVAVAILNAGGFDPAIVNPASVCFGDAEDPPARTCREVHDTGHREDVDKDKDIDLNLHYEVRKTGIDVGDTSVCLTGTTFAGRTIVGCDAAKTTK